MSAAALQPPAPPDPRAARDVPPGTSWAFRDHRTMAEIMRAEAEEERQS